jgi:hypothetical protein
LPLVGSVVVMIQFTGNSEEVAMADVGEMVSDWRFYEM